MAITAFFEDVSRFGAMLESEAIEVYGPMAVMWLHAFRWVEDVNDHLWAAKDIRLELRASSELEK